MRSRRDLRLLLQIVLVAVLLLGAAGASFHRWVEQPGGEPIPPAAGSLAPAVAREEAVVESVSGSVQRSAGTGWARVAVGDRLRADESVRTGRGASTALRIDEKSRLTVQETTQLTIRELTERVHRFKLTRGRVAIDYKPNGERVLRIENEGSDAVAEAREARFSILSTGTSVAIATESGSVKLKSAHRIVRIDAGEQAMARAGAAPTAAAPIPTEVLLKVANAAASGTTLCADVEGTVANGAEVLVDGQPATVDAQGRFSVRVPRTRDKKLVLVATRDAAGHERRQEIPCTPEIDAMSIRWKRSRQ
jgi:hypothetical protein